MHLRFPSRAFVLCTCERATLRGVEERKTRGEWKKNMTGSEGILLKNKGVKSHLAPAAVKPFSIEWEGSSLARENGSFKRPNHMLHPIASSVWGVKKKKKGRNEIRELFFDSCSADARSRGYKRSTRKCNHKIKAAFNRSNQCFYISRSTPCFHQAWSILLINLPCVRLISNCLCNVQMFKKHL